jgi:hypothetical protein
MGARASLDAGHLDADAALDAGGRPGRRALRPDWDGLGVMCGVAVAAAVSLLPWVLLAWSAAELWP